MDDAELDQALKTALSVSPSPEFVAKVRAAIADEPTPATATRWLVPAGALALVAAFAIGLTQIAFQRKVPADMPATTHSAGDILLSPAPDDTAGEPLPHVARLEATRQPKTQDATFRTATPDRQDFDVIISPTDAAAYRRLFESVASITYRLSDEPPVESENRAMTAIDITPIEIAPLNDLSNDTGRFQ